ncbi:hypothetical protein EG328_004093 [Venturia inaequalis]|uniref:Glycoside hydrolase family 71 protein n=1 Tax=Venturia inaequalis TaxID=5025 RepID=A0A8H3UPM8_VENIN|nr:hypothetical protein EG328_004093 [Venturia inaequalis]
MRLSSAAWVLCAAQTLLPGALAKAVFAHYMVGSVTEAHAHQDIDDAVAMGLDGFVLNTGDPKPYYVKNNFDYMFNYTRDKYGGKFWLFLSIDIQTPGLTNEYTDIFREFKDHDAYYKGPNGRSFLSTFDSKALTNVHWQSFLNKFANSTYFVPDFDDTLGYYEASIGWWKYWGSIVDGLFSWESAWPPAVSGLGGAYPGDIGLDKIVQDGATARGKTYMIALSPLQYKNSYGNNYYRPGDLNLPRRMAGILGMSPSPDFVEIITWNDGPESHYIGTIWPEPNDNKQAAVYTPPGLAAPHTAWQPLITSFINAFKSNLSATAMTPATGDAVGALWYKPIMQNTKCANESLGGFYAKPAGFNKTTDQLNWAIVLPPGAEGYTVRLYTGNSTKIHEEVLVGGLNFNATSGGLRVGEQSMDLLLNGKVVQTAKKGRSISDNCPDGIYNMNPQVVGLRAVTG